MKKPAWYWWTFWNIRNVKIFRRSSGCRWHRCFRWLSSAWLQLQQCTISTINNHNNRRWLFIVTYMNNTATRYKYSYNTLNMYATDAKRLSYLCLHSRVQGKKSQKNNKRHGQMLSTVITMTGHKSGRCSSSKTRSKKLENSTKVLKLSDCVQHMIR